METSIPQCHSKHSKIIHMSDFHVKEFILLTQCLFVKGDVTVNGTIYNVKHIHDLYNLVDYIDKSWIPTKHKLDDAELICVENDVIIDGNLIICDELGYNITINGSLTSLSTMTI